jgi:hypothetical protein
MLVFVGLNPSIADEDKLDPTLRRVVNFAKDWGNGGVEVLNAFSMVATNPADMVAALDRNHADADRHIRAALADAGRIIVGWGANMDHPALAPRIIELRRLLPAGADVYCWDRTAKGQPKHPLYVSAATQPVVYWRAA